MGQQRDNKYRTEMDMRIVSDSSVYNDGIRFCLQKGQKLSSAVHLVTSHLVPNEPLRTDLRRYSVHVVSDVARLADVHEGSLLGKTILALTSLISVAAGARIISSSNAALLKAEYESLSKVISSVSNKESSVILQESLSEPEDIDIRLLLSRNLQPPKRKDVGELNPSTIEPRDRSPERRKVILDLLSRTSKVTVRDLASVISGVSEKTLQRELVAMVEEGVLKREGERRWSTYSLVSSIPSPIKDIS